MMTHQDFGNVQAVCVSVIIRLTADSPVALEYIRLSNPIFPPWPAVVLNLRMQDAAAKRPRRVPESSRALLTQQHLLAVCLPTDLDTLGTPPLKSSRTAACQY